ncbi:hypothetical protein RFI_04451 [Reticulomyxa filosa]|uniref:Prolyl 4-hydroxylase alpha subunit domain-containing protein n=1 Tax=Reticulomyxa filosa TaxID=46433 RepID=X6P3K6_RETFI|nr:hypothetical protein RFI_04451 [Reticulomyxa filosa]|eukprot:ETO32669.1 hypothetical protein RFI_04451 [Reticulomyxa filosa]
MYFSLPSWCAIIWALSAQVFCLGFEITPTHFNFPLDNLEHPSVKSLIETAANALQTESYFQVKNFLSADFLKHLQEKMINEAMQKGVRRDVFKSVFGDQKDLINFSEDHPRNMLGNLRMTFIGRSDTPPEYVSIYSYPPLRAVLEKVLQRAKQAEKFSRSLHFFGCNKKKKTFFLFSLSSHLFQIFLRLMCVYLRVCIGKYEWNWDTIGAILRNESAAVQNFVGAVSANEGDMYCFEGNRTMHAVAPIFGDKLRGVFVGAFAYEPNFVHSKHVHQLNAWGDHKKEKQNCMGNEDCLKDEL